MRLGNVSLDGATTRLIAAARATQMSESLPKDSARQLVASARALRLYLEAGQHALAREQLMFVQLLVSSDDVEESLLKAYGRLTEDVQRALTRWEAA